MTDALITTTRLQQKIQAAIAEFGPKAEVFAYAICLAQRNEDHEWYTAQKKEGVFTIPKAPVVVPEISGHELITTAPKAKAGGSTLPTTPVTLASTPSIPPTASKPKKKSLLTSKRAPKKARSFTGKPSASRFK